MSTFDVTAAVRELQRAARDKAVEAFLGQAHAVAHELADAMHNLAAVMDSGVGYGISLIDGQRLVDPEHVVTRYLLTVETRVAKLRANLICAIVAANADATAKGE